MMRLYRIATAGGHDTTDCLIAQARRLALGPVGGSGVLGHQAFIQLWRDSDEGALDAAIALLGPHKWIVSTGYGIHHRIVRDARR